MRNLILRATTVLLLASSPGCQSQERIDDAGAPPPRCSPADSATGEPPSWPKCVKSYDGSGGQFFGQLECLPQLDQIHFWESRAAFDAFDSAPVTVAVIDGFFNVDHPDLEAAIAQRYSLADPGCYPVDLAKSACLEVRPPANVIVTDQNIEGLNHGSMIAGLIAGRGVPGQGVVGVNLARASSSFRRPAILATQQAIFVRWRARSTCTPT